MRAKIPQIDILTYSFPVHSNSCSSSNAIVEATVGSVCGPGTGTAARDTSSQSASMTQRRPLCSCFFFCFHPLLRFPKKIGNICTSFPRKILCDSQLSNRATHTGTERSRTSSSERVREFVRGSLQVLLRRF